MVEGRPPHYGTGSTDGVNGSVLVKQQQQQQQEQQEHRQTQTDVGRMFAPPPTFISQAQQELKIYRREVGLCSS
jgi:ABC-type uncharacterized transport system ATPase subunit